MDDCVFCKIVAGELPSFKTYEDNLFLAFLDIKPLAPGNSLLIPKTHYRWVTDVPEFGLYWEVAKKIALKTQTVVKSDYTTFLTLGTDVPHAHIRIIPRFYHDSHGEGIDINNISPLTATQLTQLASQIKL